MTRRAATPEILWFNSCPISNELFLVFPDGRLVDRRGCRAGTEFPFVAQKGRAPKQQLKLVIVKFPNGCFETCKHIRNWDTFFPFMLLYPVHFTCTVPITCLPLVWINSARLHRSWEIRRSRGHLVTGVVKFRETTEAPTSTREGILIYSRRHNHNGVQEASRVDWWRCRMLN